MLCILAYHAQGQLLWAGKKADSIEQDLPMSLVSDLLTSVPLWR